MSGKRYFVWLLILSLAFSMIGCAGQTEPAAQEPGPVSVSTVDALLAAIAPGARIQLQEGVYSLNSASDYGKSLSPYYTWVDYGMGQYELRLEKIEDLTITGAGKSATSVITEPRWANVLSVRDCKNITLENMTLGHTEMTEACEGGVLHLDSSVNTTLKGLGLYGCGTIGVVTYGCGGVEIEDCEIYDCSIGGLQLYSSNNITVKGSSFHSLGRELPVENVISVGSCEDVVIEACSVYGNYVKELLWTYGSGRVRLQGNQIIGNRLSGAMFRLEFPEVVLDDNAFAQNELRNWYSPDSFPAVDADGSEVIFEEAPEETVPVKPGVATPVSTGAQKEVRVSTVEEFLDAIGSDTCIILEGQLLNFSDCEEYRTLLAESENFQANDPRYYPQGRKNHYWVNEFDGPALVIYDVTNLTIKAEGEDRTVHTVSAVPRYSDVLTFEDCSAITLAGFTAGHTVEPGYCCGGVFSLRGCTDVLIENCGMYGCGTEGVDADSCRNIQIVNSEIYECSYSAINLNSCDKVAISGTLIRDIQNDWEPEAPHFVFFNSSNVTLDGTALDGNYYGR